MPLMSKDIELIIKKYKPGRREELIPLLQDIQDEHGYLSEESIVRVGNFVGLSTTKILDWLHFTISSSLFPQEKSE